ncbi:MAG: trypsin-like peptidase domain-containing protein, partial [Eubacteriales bacterium]
YLFGGAALHSYLNPNESAAPSVVYTTPSTGVTTVAAHQTTTGALTLPELYAQNVGSAVGITVSLETTNFYGQPTSSGATGSGFVITSDGYVVTNYHVIERVAYNSDTPIEVSFQDGSRYDATLVGYESDNDIAVLKISGGTFTPVVLGDSDGLVVGEMVAAIGNPLGELDFSFTDGIISAKDRLISSSDSTMNMLQTNVAINPGNSGGPLFDSSGAVIGINTAKYTNASDGTTVEGLGFAIPINDVKEMLQDLIAHGYVTGKPYLGVGVENVSPSTHQNVSRTGAAIVSIAPNGAADLSGLEVGDIIIQMGNHDINSIDAITAALTNYRAGDTIEITVLRENQEHTFSLVLDEKNDETVTNNPLPEVTQQPSQSFPSSPFDGFFP